MATMENLFPNSQFQLWTGMGPGWDGGATPIYTHLSNFETEIGWVYANGNLPGVDVSYISSRSVSSADTYLPGLAGSGQKLIEATGDDNVQYLYPNCLIVFAGNPTLPPAIDPSLQLSAFRVRSIDYTAKTFTFLAVRNQVPPTGTVAITCRQIMRCDLGAQNTGDGPDGWGKFPATTHLWPDRWPPVPTGPTDTMIFDPTASAPDRPAWRCNQRPSTKRSVVFRPQSNGDAYFFHRVPDRQVFAGRTITFGMWVRRVGGTGAAVGRLGVNDGLVTKSGVTAVGTEWAWLEMTHKVADVIPTELGIGFYAENSNQVCWQIVEPTLVFGNSLGQGNYQIPARRLETLTVKSTPDSYFGADFILNNTGTTELGWGHTFDPYAETAGSISEDTKFLFINVDYTADVLQRVVAFRNKYAPPQIFGPVNRSSAAGLVTYLNGLIELAADGTCWITSNSGNAEIIDMSIDIDQAITR
jgi:hypothetical protein